MLQPVNVEDINQLLAYHEVFGKLQGGGVAVAAEGEGAVVERGEEGRPLSPPGVHTCDLCSKVFSYRYQLIVHRRYHTERKAFQCQVLKC